MFRFLLAAVGLIQLAAPDWVVYVYTRLAYERPEVFRVRPWVPVAIRLEGALLLWLAIDEERRQGTPEASVVERVRQAPETR